MPQKMKHTLKGVQVATTILDKQGEKFSKEDLEDYVDDLPSRVSLGAFHDQATSPPAFLEGLRIEEIPDQPGEWQILADLHYDELPREGGVGQLGLSVSFLKKVDANSEETEGSVYIPFPHYRNEELTEKLLEIDQPIAVGRYVAKSADGAVAGIIFSSLLFLAGPAYTNLWNERIRPFLDSVLRRVSEPDFDGMPWDYCQPVEIRGQEVTCIFISDRDQWKVCLEPDRIRKGIDVAMTFLLESEIAAVKPVSRLRLKYRGTGYEPILVEYEDGQTLTLG